MLFWPREGNLRGDQIKGVYEVLGEKRKLFLYGPVLGMPNRTDTFGPSYIADAIMACNESNCNEPIWLFIDSEGGYVRDGYILYDTMKLSKAPIYTVGRNCYSMGAIILAAGELGHRYVYPNSHVMLHLPSGGFSGQVNDTEIQLEELRKVKNKLITSLVECGCKKDASAILQDIDRDKYFNAEEAIEYGIADAIVGKNTFDVIK